MIQIKDLNQAVGFYWRGMWVTDSGHKDLFEKEGIGKMMRMRKKVKRLTAIVLALLMVASMMPMMASAAIDDLASLQAALAGSSAIKLEGDITGDVTIPASFNKALNLAGYTIYGTVTNESTSTTTIIRDSVGTGSVIAPAGQNALINEGTIKIESGTFKANDTNVAVYTLATGDQDAATTITGGTFEAGHAVLSGANTTDTTGKAQVTISNAKASFSGNIEASTKTNEGGASTAEAEIRITNGTFKDGKLIVSKNDSSDKASIIVTNGTFYTADGTISIPGNTKIKVNFKNKDSSQDLKELAYMFTGNEFELGKALPIPSDLDASEVFHGWNFKRTNGTEVVAGTYKILTEELFVELMAVKQTLVAEPSVSPRVTISAASNINGTVTVNEDAPTEGELVTVTAVPDSGYIMSKPLTVKNGADDIKVNELAGNKYTFTYPADGVVTIDTEFAIGISIAKSANGTVTVPNITPTVGDTVIITAEPDEGYMLKQLTVYRGTDKFGVVDLGNNKYSFTFPSGESVTISAEFVNKSIVITKTGEGTVTVTPSTPTAGQPVTLTVTPAKNYILGQLTVKNGTRNVSLTNKGNGVYTFDYPATGTVTIDVLFSIGIVISEMENGAVQVDKPAPTAGETVTITVISDPGYILKELIVKNGDKALSGVKDNKDGTHTFTYPTGTDVLVTIEAEFIPGVTIAKTVNGTVKISKENPAKDDTVTITVTPDKGYKLDKMTVKNGNVTITPTDNGNGTYSFAYPDGGTIHIEVTFTASIPFTDVPTSQWYYDAVVFVYDNSLFEGTSKTVFSPNKNMNRAMMVQVLFNMTDGAKKGENKFTDVPNSQWYTDAVTWASTNGVVNGVGNNRFAPLSDITREQMALMLYNYAKLMKIDLPKTRSTGAFADGGYISSWAKEAVNAMYAAEVINGKGDNKFDPQGKATRAQVAEMFMNFVNVTSK